MVAVSNKDKLIPLWGSVGFINH
ncbi:MAG: hypothetical protein JWP88_2317, partial [Flaviaesturariibacter sp.]|nr:hypothetical protein [Flaviaesturariibacter sp.]